MEQVLELVTWIKANAGTIISDIGFALSLFKKDDLVAKCISFLLIAILCYLIFTKLIKIKESF